MQVLARWIADRSADELAEPSTFVVGLDGRRGALRAGRGRVVRNETANQSTGYCPDPDSWPAVAVVPDRVGLAHPGEFTHKIIFRRCPACCQLNIVRDGDFACTVCDSALPAHWNIGSA